MRLNSQPRTRASVRTSSVLATPGTPSISAWWPVKMAIRQASTTACLADDDFGDLGASAGERLFEQGERFGHEWKDGQESETSRTGKKLANRAIAFSRQCRRPADSAVTTASRTAATVSSEKRRRTSGLFAHSLKHARTSDFRGIDCSSRLVKPAAPSAPMMAAGRADSIDS